ncbi:MAG TPA: LuxR C-terminal-related transcriptional regulator, partial [Acidimicrobiia bacterium]|nr:LuxR C-terminal-related transcriptional regulator [Acidimicrobiia bacterium]
KQLGNQVLLLLARTAVWPRDEQARWEVLEDSWEIAQRSHSFIMRNMAAHRLGAFHVRYGSPLDGLLVLRTPARDWLLHGDARVWDVLYSMAAGFASLGDLETAGRLRAAIGDHHIGTVVSRRERDLLEGALDRLEHSERLFESVPVDAGAAVALALERIEAVAIEAEDATARPDAETIELTARQLEVANLVARGLSNKAIAARLGVSRYTVETHVRNILDRLDATSRTQIVAWVMAYDSP